jgi:hypothetical protein
MRPLQYEELVREYQRIDLLREAAQRRLVVYPYGSRVGRALRRTAQVVACRLSLPGWELACAPQPV